MLTTTVALSLRRAALLATTAYVFGAVQPAYAGESSGDGMIAAVAPEAQSSVAALAPVQPDPYLNIAGVAPELDSQIVISNPGTPTTARDDAVNVTGIGQMIVDSGGGSVGLCTGTLINPRTVIFAAHCVNSRPATAYGAASGGTAIGFGFEANLRAETAGAPDELLRWLLGTGPSATGRFQTNVASSFFNVNQVVYNAFSLEPAARSFLYGDVALATLDTPAAKVPTWALLFSPLPTPATAGAGGTGYNVQLVGYGRSGNAATGSSGGVDFRRRAAENMIGALTDLRTFENFLFGSSTSPTQNLYFIDFDDPRRGLSGASAFDFNAFRDNARAKEGVGSEGITASGDSGGPLILQTFTKQIVAGVLSGGYTRFFNAQPANGYGTVSFYQPLYLYWDWIAANNPYHYVTAAAGDGQWTDPTRWVTTLDPAYTILSGGTLVNGIPTSVGDQKNGTGGGFGEMCFESGGRSQCQNIATGVFTDVMKPIGTVDDNAGQAQVRAIVDGTQKFSDGVFDEVVLEAHSHVPGLPAATLSNGLPGATNFVPNNVDPVRTTGTLARYFDVTLAATGTTTLSGAAVTIDRLTIGTAGAGLVIASGASLNTLINTTQFAGTVTVNGTLSSVGDYSLLGGALLGSGRINAPFLTSVMGQFAPGTGTTIGTLTIGGNLVMASASQYFVNLGGNGVSDRIAVVANGGSAGSANVGGSLSLSSVPGTIARFGDLYTILTAEGGVTGTFATPSTLSAILRPSLIYTNNAVQLQVTAVPYASVVSSSSAVQTSFAALLDANRAVGAQPGLYDVLDLQSQATIRSTLDALAPRTETLRSSLGLVVTDNNARLIRSRMSGLGTGNLGGSLALMGSAPRMTALVAGLSNNAGPAGSIPGTLGAAQNEVSVREGRLPETMSAFLAGGYLEGESMAMTTVPALGNDQFDGWFIAGGIETEVGERTIGGFALSHTDLDGAGAAGHSVGATLTAGTLYAKHTNGPLVIDGQFSAGLYSSDTSRAGNLPGAPYTLRSEADSLALGAEANVGAMFGDAFRFGPKVGVRWSQIDFDRSVESGGPTALIIDRDDFTSLQGRAGVEFEGRGRVRPTASATFVHEFDDRPGVFAARFAGSVSPVTAPFALASQDRDWAELSAGLTFSAGGVDLSIGADTTVGRKDVENQAYRGSVTFRF